MAKTLPLVGIVAAVLAALSASVLTGDVVPILVLLALVAIAVLLFMERAGALTMALGVVVAILALLALLSYPVNGKNGTILPSLPYYFTGPWQPTLLVAGVLAIAVARRDQFVPTWLLWVALAGAVLAACLVAPVAKADFGTGGSVLGDAAALFCLLLVWPMVALLRSPVASSPPSHQPSP